MSSSLTRSTISKIAPTDTFSGMFFTLLADLAKKLPILCWCIAALCALMYTTTICYVMLRSSEVNVTIDGMTMEMTRAAATTDSAATDLDAAAKTVADLKAQLAEAKNPLTPRGPLMLTAPAPVAAVLAPVETELKAKASRMREQSQQIQQQVQQQQQQQQQR